MKVHEDVGRFMTVYEGLRKRIKGYECAWRCMTVYKVV